MSRIKDTDLLSNIAALLSLLATISFTTVSQTDVLYALVILAELLKLYYASYTSSTHASTGANIAGRESKCVEIRLLITVRNALVHGEYTPDDIVSQAFDNDDFVLNTLRKSNIPEVVINLYLFCSAHKDIVHDAYMTMEAK